MNPEFYWQPACGGTETPFTLFGYRLIYMYNTVTKEHAYLDLGRDVFLTVAEFEALVAQNSRWEVTS